MSEKILFSSESVTEGHPDKVCDQISDAVLDAMLAQDPNARVACETCATTGVVFVMGEITTAGYVDIPGIVRKTVRRIGYDSVETGFDGNTCAVLTAINEQSADIAMGVDCALETRAGRRQGRHRRGRPGHDVRLCLRSDGVPHAASDHAGARPFPPPGGSPPRRFHAVSSSRR